MKLTLGSNDLATVNPQLATEWDLEKNYPLTPHDVVAGSSKLIWWRCSKGHSWQARVSSRTGGSGCPVCAGRQVWIGYNDLTTVNPQLASEWDLSKNAPLTPRDVTARSNTKVWWICSHGHSWRASVNNRSHGYGCPICSGKQALAGYNDLATANPQLAAEWDLEKNAPLTPQDVTAGVGIKVWWRCSQGHSWLATVQSRSRGIGCPICADYTHKYWDAKNGMPRPGLDLGSTHPATAAEWDLGKNAPLTPQDVTAGSHALVWWRCSQGHSWQATVAGRISNNTDCPICSGKQVLIGYNDLATVNPQLAAEWDLEKNAPLTPQDVTAGSRSKVWWRCSQGHSWQASIYHRHQSATSCPICNSKQVFTGCNDLATVNPQLAAEWDLEKNAPLTPQDVTAGSARKVWWRCSQGHSWLATVQSRSHGYGCPICSGKQVLAGYNDLATVNPQLAAEWNLEKNAPLTPQDVTTGSRAKVWWRCSQGHSWQAQISARSQGRGCPICKGHQVLAGYNDLATVNPQLAAEWDLEKNAPLTPQDVTTGSRAKVWWRCSQGHSWQAQISARSQGRGCPICKGNQVLAGYNDLATANPQLATEWDLEKNAPLTPQNVVAGSHKKVWWRCSQGHSWQAAVYSRTQSGSGCPYCANYAQRRKRGV